MDLKAFSCRIEWSLFQVHSTKHARVIQLVSSCKYGINIGPVRICIYRAFFLCYISLDIFMFTLSLFLAVKNKDIQNKIFKIKACVQPCLLLHKEVERTLRVTITPNKSHTITLNLWHKICILIYF